MKRRWSIFSLCCLPVLALACAHWPQDRNLLYPAAFRVNAVQSCASREPQLQTQCLQGVLSDSLINHPDTPAQLPLIRYSSLRDLHACTAEELQQVRQAGGQRADLWVCMSLLHYPQRHRPVAGVALAVDTSPAGASAAIQITQLVSLPIPR